jgi:hypothetical protein
MVKHNVVAQHNVMVLFESLNLLEEDFLLDSWAFQVKTEAKLPDL